MKTISPDLEKDQRLDVLSELFKNKKIKLGKDEFELIIYSYFKINETLYAGFLLLLTKYFIQELNKENHNKLNTHNENEFSKGYFDAYTKFYDI